MRLDAWHGKRFALAKMMQNVLDIKGFLASGVGPPHRPLRNPGTDMDLCPSHLHDLMLANWHEADLIALRQLGVGSLLET